MPVAEANAMSTSQAKEDLVCERNWQASCPQGWNHHGENCIASGSYGGDCKRAQPVRSTVVEKQRFAESCRAPWPCANDDCPDGRNYDVPCPASWNEEGGGFCSAPLSLSTRCAKSYNFAAKTDIQKEELAITCGHVWPCRQACVQNYRAACPDGWTSVPQNPTYCVAGSDYSGICSYGVNVTGMTDNMKQAFARKCAAPWPCAAVGKSAGARGANGQSERGIQVSADRATLPEGPVDSRGSVVEVFLSEPKGFRGHKRAVATYAPYRVAPVLSGPVSGEGEIHNPTFVR